MKKNKQRNIVPLSSVGLKDIDIAGGKNASLGEMLQNLVPLGVQVPDGFVITVKAFRYFLNKSKVEDQIAKLLSTIDFDKIESLRRAGLQIRSIIRNTEFPSELSEEIINAYYELSEKYKQDSTDVAVRSSATAEDLPDASFAGQQETYLNVRGPAELVIAVRNCFASLFTDRAISYRHNLNYDHFEVGLAVGVQKMVRSDLGMSGVAFSLDTESGFKDAVIINGSYGLGELIVQGAILPDEFIVFKPTLEEGYCSIIEKKLGVKDKMMVYGDNPDERLKVIPVGKKARKKFCLNNQQVIRLAKWVCQIEDYYSLQKRQWCPMDVEWAVDGQTNELYIVQARPETIYSKMENTFLVEYKMNDNQKANVLLKGIAVGNKIATGNVCILHSLDKRISAGLEFVEGDVLVTDRTDPDWEPIMKKAAAIITNKGGRTCHAAIVAREMGVPAIVGCGKATETLTEGITVTVSCAEGEEGYIYEGTLQYETIETRLDELPSINTSLMLNIGSPGHAFRYASLPLKGVGLAREEFIINNYIGIHPLALLGHEELNDIALSRQIKERIQGFENGVQFFIEKLSFGIAKIAAAFYPETVIVRFSDFKSNEYYNLLGGNYFEPKEENPMLGWRGASRYYSKEYRAAFALECSAIRKVREHMGLRNVAVMIPFCRTVQELIKVKEVMAEFGLEAGKEDLNLYLMAELPSNIILAREFGKHIDGFSIGSNDLTQLTLGLDRDSSLVSHIYDERNEAVKEMLRMLIKAAKESKVKIGICGQGPSDFTDFAQFLVEEGIDSISVTPDSVVRTIKAIKVIEQNLLQLNEHQF